MKLERNEKAKLFNPNKTVTQFLYEIAQTSTVIGLWRFYFGTCWMYVASFIYIVCIAWINKMREKNQYDSSESTLL